MEKRKQNQTFTNGFMKSGDPDRTVTSTFESTTQANNVTQANASRSNGFALFGGHPNRTSTTGGNQRFGDQPLIGDDKDLKSDALNVSKEEMKERLFVAEKVMKTLFKRNKDLEEMHMDQKPVASENGDCPKCSGRDDFVDRNRVKDLEKQLEQAMAAQQQEKSSEPQSYKDFMAMRLEQSQAESKRHFENYVNIRDQLNQMLDKQAQQLSSPQKTPNASQQFVTPKSVASIKSGNKLR